MIIMSVLGVQQELDSSEAWVLRRRSTLAGSGSGHLNNSALFRPRRLLMAKNVAAWLGGTLVFSRVRGWVGYRKYIILEGVQFVLVPVPYMFLGSFQFVSIRFISFFFFPQNKYSVGGNGDDFFSLVVEGASSQT